jgi:hypothetical protein
MAIYSSALASTSLSLRHRYRFASGSDPEEDGRKPASDEYAPAEQDDLPYRVELWNAARNSVEQVLAVTANANIGYAAYYAATREHPDRYITLRHNNSYVSRWNGPTN